MEQVGGAHDGDVLDAAEDQEVVIPGYDEVGVSADRGLQDDSVILVADSKVELPIGFHQFTGCGYQGDCTFRSHSVRPKLTIELRLAKNPP